MLGKRFPRERAAVINTAIQHFQFYRQIMGYSEEKAQKLALKFILEKENEMALARS